MEVLNKVIALVFALSLAITYIRIHNACDRIYQLHEDWFRDDDEDDDSEIAPQTPPATPRTLGADS